MDEMEISPTDRGNLKNLKDLSVYWLISNTGYARDMAECLYKLVNAGKPHDPVSEERCRDVIALDFIDSIKNIISNSDINEVDIVRVLGAFFQHCRINNIVF